MSSLPPSNLLSETLIHPVRRGLDFKAPFMCLPAPGLWQVNTDDGMCFRKGDPLNPCIRKLNMRGPGSIPHTEQHTRMFSSGPCVQRSREAGLWGVQTTLSRQATEREGPLSSRIYKVTPDTPMSTPAATSLLRKVRGPSGPPATQTLQARASRQVGGFFS